MTVIDTPTESEQPDSAPDPDSSTPLGSLVVIAMIAIIVVTVAVIGAVAVAALVTSDSDDGAGFVASAASTDLNVSLVEFSIEGDLTAPAGNVTLNVSNDGSMEHNVVVPGLGLRTPTLTAGGNAVLDLGVLEPGTYKLLCDISGHEAAGMVTELVVTGEGGGEAAAGGGEAAGAEEELDSAALDQRMIDSMMAYPAETEGSGNQPLEPEILDDGTKLFELTAAVTPWEKSPGEFVDAWTYNGMVPGPQIKVDLGDNVRVVVNNETPLGTDVHWHGISTPNDQDGVSPYTQDPIRSGDTFTYEFVAERNAIGMYHAHLHSQISVPNGMFGVFIIGENPIPYGETYSDIQVPTEAEMDLAFEMPMVLNDAGVIGLSLNGKSFPATEPVVMEQGQWGVAHYYNEGLTVHPMHLHQMPQLVYAKDGIPLDHPYWADTINVAPGERYSVLFNADTVGTWVYHCHILTHVERTEGMFGMVTAMIVNPKP